MARAASAASTGAVDWVEANRAAPTRTSFTSRPGVEAKAWLTRRIQEPQCMLSMRRVNSLKGGLLY